MNLQPVSYDWHAWMGGQLYACTECGEQFPLSTMRQDEDTLDVDRSDLYCQGCALRAAAEDTEDDSPLDCPVGCRCDRCKWWMRLEDECNG